MLTGEAVIFPVQSVAPFSLKKTFCFNNSIMIQYSNWKLNRKRAYSFVPRRNVIIAILGEKKKKKCD